MPSKAMISRSDSQNPDTAPFTLSAPAWEDLTDEPAFNLTPAGRAETSAADCLSLGSENVKQNLTAFLLAYQERQNARGSEACVAAMAVEERTALSLAWSILNELGLL